MSRPTFVTIDSSALRYNLNRVREQVGHSKIIAMVKANAYGHSMVNVAKALPAADAFGVASLEEGLMLREAGITQPIVLMEGLFQAEELLEADKHRFTIVVHHEAQLKMLEQAALQQPVSVWLKINTGMHRLGVSSSSVQSFFNRLQQCASVKKPIGLMSHFAEADLLNSVATQKQIELFHQVTTGLEGFKSLANSAAILTLPSTHEDWVRPGLMLYGASPFADKTGLDHGLKPVMTFSSRIIAIIPVNKGGSVGYGGTWTASQDTFIGVVGAGYGDGYPQFAQNGTPVLLNGKRASLAGRVSMDMLTIDLHDHPSAKIGDTVVLWGEGLPVENIARYAKTSPYELLTRMTARPKLSFI